MEAENTYKLIIQTPTSWKLPKHSRLGPIKKVYGLIYEKVTNLISTGSFPLEIPRVCLDSGNGELHVLGVWFFHDYITVSSLKSAMLNELKHNRPVLDSPVVNDILKRSIGTIYIPASSLSKSIKTVKNSRPGGLDENMYTVFERRSILKFRIAIEPDFVPLSEIKDLEDYFQKLYHKKQIGINRAGFHIFDVNDNVGPSNLSFIHSQSTSERNFPSRSYRYNEDTPSFYSKISPTHNEPSPMNKLNKDRIFHSTYPSPTFGNPPSLNIATEYTAALMNYGRNERSYSNNSYNQTASNSISQSYKPEMISNDYYPGKELEYVSQRDLQSSKYDSNLVNQLQSTIKNRNEELNSINRKYKSLLGSFLSLAYRHHKQQKLYQECNKEKERYVVANLSNMLKFLNQKRKLQASRATSKTLAKQLLVDKAKNTKLKMKLAATPPTTNENPTQEFIVDYNNLKEVNDLLNKENLLLIEQNGEVKNILSMTREKHEIELDLLNNQINHLKDEVDKQTELIKGYKQEITNYNQAILMLKDDAEHQDNLIEQYKQDLAKYKSGEIMSANRSASIRNSDEFKRLVSINDGLNEQLKSVSTKNAELKNQNAILSFRIKQLETCNTNQVEKKLDQISDFITRNIQHDGYHVVKDRITDALTRCSQYSNLPPPTPQTVIKPHVTTTPNPPKFVRNTYNRNNKHRQSTDQEAWNTRLRNQYVFTDGTKSYTLDIKPNGPNPLYYSQLAWELSNPTKSARYRVST